MADSNNTIHGSRNDTVGGNDRLTVGASQVVSVGASYAWTGGPGFVHSSAAKAGLKNLTESLAVEWARFNINVNAIAPGAFSSEMMDGMIARMGDITKNFPRPRLGDPAQLDSTLLFLVSPASEFVTGTTVRVDDAQGGR